MGFYVFWKVESSQQELMLNNSRSKPAGTNSIAVMIDFRFLPPNFSCRKPVFSIVMELGTHQQIPSDSDIKAEFDRTFQSILFFFKEAPLVNLKHQYSNLRKAA